VDIRRIICLPKEPQPIFELELMDLPERTIKLGTHKEGIMNQANFRSRIGAMGLPMPNKVGKDTWDPQIINYLRVLTEVGEIPITATYEGQINTWLREYISSKEIAQDLNEHFTESESDPFMHKDRVFFKLETLQDWIRTTKNHQIDFTFQQCLRRGLCRKWSRTRTGGRLCTGHLRRDFCRWDFFKEIPSTKPLGLC